MYILGPCSAESREQVLETASRICDLKSQIADFHFVYRAGVWKPRTSPYTFQGIGDEGLGWLAEVKQRFGVPVATEVVLPEHVEAALHAGIDYLWIGARTSANPIAVQVIADAIGIQNTDHRIQTENVSTLSAKRSVLCQPKAVLIKNPVNADAGLWLGNIERLEKTGIPVIAVHRGCNHQPCWGMAHQVRIARPDIPMLLDPSHMSGDAARVPALLEKITDLQLDGAMIEVHCCPEKALSDRAQQLTPTCLRDTLDSILSRLCLASLICPSDSPTELNWLRAEIDELDDRLWETMAARMDVSRRIGIWKKAHDITPLQPQRFQQILDARREWAQKNGVDGAFVEKVFDLIHQESLKKQE